LVKITKALMDRVIQVYYDAGVDLPDRKIVTLGEPVYDSEQLVVSFTDMSEGLVQGEDPQSPCYIPVNATFKITVVRCAPVADNRGNPPTPEQLNAATYTSLIDAYLLMKSSCRFDMWGSDVDGLPPSALGGMGVNVTVDVIEAQGGMQGVALNVTTVLG
jgi:hypothetical protein